MKKNILLIGVGGTGSNAVDTFFKKFKELGNQTDNKVSALVFDTDAGDLKKITDAKTVVMADSASVGTICDRIGKQYLREWFPCDAKDVRAQEMVRGASQWRKKSYLAFLNLMNKPAARQTFISALEEMVQDPGASCEVYVIASVAGGTGSGSFIPIALYAKRYLRKNLGKDPIVNAMIALPDIYADSQTPENKVKVYSNAYAILRELNAINLVARNYNAGLAAKKKAPVKFRIGHPDEPNVGVLFDASDKKFWTPEAAPFSQVFLLDRIPGLNSISAHDMVLANSLYTIICTEIGAAFDSEFSNHELVRSQNNGSNAIYAGISTSQVRFPKESVLDYLAHRKTLESCESEWLTIHKTVENTIHEKEREAKELRRHFSLKDGAYANMVLEAVEQKIEENNDSVISIVERSVNIYDEDGKVSTETAGERYMAMIDDYIRTRIPDVDEVRDTILSELPSAARATKNTVAGLIKNTLPESFLECFQSCLEAVKCVPMSTADSVITLNKKKVGTIGDKYSVIANLIQTEKGEDLHPVAALIRLCQFRAELADKIPESFNEWPEVKQRNVVNFPARYYSSLDDVNDRSAAKSAYAAMGEERYTEMLNDTEKYLKAKTKVDGDMSVLRSDITTILNKVYAETVYQVSVKTYKLIAADIDLVIAKYRSFFNRFEKEKETLEELTRDAKRKDAGTIDSVINVYSTEDDKDVINDILSDGNGPETTADILATDSIVGEGVLKYVMDAAISERAEDENFNDNASGAYRSLFTSMVNAYRKSISKSEMYKNIASYNAIEAIVASCGENADHKKLDDALRSTFSVAQELAIPSLRLENNLTETDLVTPSHIMVFMLSRNTAKYIKSKSDKFGIKLPADQSGENSILRSCAEQFVRDYSGNNSARVAIVDSVPDQIIYCTGEIMDITPLCIAKFNELGEDSIYFRNYRDAINRYKKYETDMWNPHIGNDLFKRGYLPYMNPVMERECDEKMIKALLYALSAGRIRYVRGIGEDHGVYNFVCDQQKIKANASSYIDNKNIHELLNWLRNQDHKIDEWSVAFDRSITEQMQTLPSVLSEDEVKVLEQKLTTLPFMRMLNEKLYKDDSIDGSKGTISIVEFAYTIKMNEEEGRDCDDAERILALAYKVFKELISFRIPPETHLDRFVRVYRQQLKNFYVAVANSDIIKKDGKQNASLFVSLVDWMNRAGLFMTVSKTEPLDALGNVAIDKFFKTATVMNEAKTDDSADIYDSTDDSDEE